MRALDFLLFTSIVAIFYAGFVCGDRYHKVSTMFGRIGQSVEKLWKREKK